MSKLYEEIKNYLANKANDPESKFLMDSIGSEANLLLQQGDLVAALPVMYKANDLLSPFVATYVAMEYYKFNPHYIPIDKKSLKILIKNKNFEEAKKKNHETRKKADADWSETKEEMGAISPWKWIVLILALAKLIHIIFGFIKFSSM